MALFDDGDLGVGEQTNDLGGGFGTCRHTSDNDNTHGPALLRVVFWFGLRNRGQGKAERQGSPSQVACFRTDATAGGFGYGLDKSESQSGSGIGRLLHGRAPDKGRENTVTFVFGDPDAGIAHREDYLLLLSVDDQTDTNLPVLGCVLQGVVEECRDRFLESVTVDSHRNRLLGKIAEESDSSRRGLVLTGADHFSGESSNVTNGSRTDVARNGRGDSQHAGDRFQGLIATFVGSKDEVLLSRCEWTGEVAEEHPQHHLDRGNGSTHLVRHLRREFQIVGMDRWIAHRHAGRRWDC